MCERCIRINHSLEHKICSTKGIADYTMILLVARIWICYYRYIRVQTRR